MSTYPPGICSTDGVKSPRILVLYTAATAPIGANNCPQRVCCFSDMLQVVFIVSLLSPGIQKHGFNGCFFNFSSNLCYIHSYISFQNCCQEKNDLSQNFFVAVETSAFLLARLDSPFERECRLDPFRN